MAENKGNPNHDEEGKFTTSNNNQGRRLDDPAHNPFKKKGQGPFADPDNEMENAWADLFGLGQKIIDDRKKEMHKNDNSIEDKLGKMGFESGEEKDNEMIEKAVSDLKKYSGNDNVNKDWQGDVYYQLRNNGADEKTALRLSKKFADSVPTYDEVNVDNDNEVEYDDIDPDYERSYGPVDSKEKYEDYQKWLKDNGSGRGLEHKTEKDIKEFEDTHPFEVVYDYDENGNKNGYELKFKNPKDQEEYEKLLDEVYSDEDDTYTQTESNEVKADDTVENNNIKMEDLKPSKEQEEVLNTIFGNYFGSKNWRNAMDYMADNDNVRKEIYNYIKSNDINPLRGKLLEIQKYMRTMFGR